MPFSKFGDRIPLLLLRLAVTAVPDWSSASAETTITPDAWRRALPRRAGRCRDHLSVNFITGKQAIKQLQFNQYACL